MRLIVMNFLQYAIWGAWLISLGSYLGGELKFDGLEIGSFFATMGIASLFMPAIMGVIADRWIPAQKVMGACHLIGSVFLIIAAQQDSYGLLYTFMLLSVMFYMPTIALSNSVAFNALDAEGLDSVKAFPPIRIWGTVGFIGSMISVDLLRFGQNENQLYLSAAISLALGIYSFTLPSCKTSTVKKSASWVDTFGLRAFTLFKEKKMAIFFLFSMALGMSLQITNAFGNSYLTGYFGSQPEYADTFGVNYANILISISQISETFCVLLIPFFLRRYGIKVVMLMSMLAWVLRFALLGAGDPGGGVWMLILSMLVYGIAFDFFNISGALFVNKETSSDIRSSAQGVFMIMTNGFGAFIGSYAAGAVVKAYGWPVSWFIFAGYALVVMILFAIVFKYKHNPQEELSVNH